MDNTVGLALLRIGVREMYEETQHRARGRYRDPSIVVEPGDHPLSVVQQNGISLEKAWQIVHYYQQMNARSPDNAFQRTTDVAAFSA
ncbi:MAG TPA: hypothetical protein VFQ76_20885 [Longimicrobiaceae bacterium]|nr:hypothetical protein [Longimicrobiaceae bacterium]